MKTLLTALLIASPLAAQVYPNTFPVDSMPLFSNPGTVVEKYPDNTPFKALRGSGAPAYIDCTVTYPSNDGSTLAPPTGVNSAGYPVLVFLHGAIAPPQDPITHYDLLATDFAKHGYIVVRPRCTAGGPVHEFLDGSRLPKVMTAATPLVLHGGGTSVISGGFNAAAICLGGHSLGGGAVYVAGGPWGKWANDGVKPNYKAAIAWSPWGGPSAMFKSTTGIYKGYLSTFPTLSLVGEDDNGASGPPYNFVADTYDWFNKTNSYTGAKVIMEIQADHPAYIDHDTLIGHWTNIGEYQAYVDAFEAAYGWIQVQCFGRTEYLSWSAGPDAFSSPYVKNVDSHWRVPRSYAIDEKAMDRVVIFQEVSTSSAPGQGACFAWADFSLLTTPITAPTLYTGAEWLNLQGPTRTSFIGPYSTDHWAMWGASNGWNYVTTPPLNTLGFSLYFQYLAAVDPVGSGPAIGMGDPVPIN